MRTKTKKKTSLIYSGEKRVISRRTKKTTHCIYCSKEIEVQNNRRIKPHILHKGKMCLGSGFKVGQMERHAQTLEETRN